MLYAIPPERQTTKLKVDSVAFAAFLDCPYKAYLLLVDEYARNASPPAQHTGSFGAEGSACHDLASYKQAAIQHCQAKMECHSAVPACASSRTIRHEPLDPIRTTSLDDVHTLIVELVETRTTKHRKGLLHAPVLVNPSERISKNDKLLLGFSAMLLLQNGYAPATFGRIIHGPSFRRTTVQLPQVINKARNVLKELNSIVEGTSKPCLILNPHCNVCRFSQYCRHLALQTDDVSLISSLSRKEVLNLHKRGIFTVRQLSHLYRPRRRRRYTKLPDKHIPALKALAIRENQVYVRDPPDIPKNKVDIFLDVEGLPDNNFYYLMGLKVCEGPNEQSYSFWADSTSNEPRIWAQLLSVLASMQDYTLFHYGSYEQTFIKRMVERYGCSDAATVQHLSAALVNILPYCYQHIYFPTYSNSLKDIGRFIGFQWDSPDASGAQAIEWRTTWDAGRDQSIRDRLIGYNQDDCGALKALTGALREIIERGKVGHQSVSNATEVAATSPYGLGKNAFAFPEFDYINKCAYFDYQRTKIYWRTNKRVKRITLRSRTPRRRRHKRLNAVVQSKSRTCPACKNAGILVDRRMEKVSYDLRFGPSGIKAWTTKYIGLRQWCPSCGSTFLPRSYPKGKYKYGHGLLAWVIYNKIGLRQTDESVRVGLNELFGFRFS